MDELFSLLPALFIFFFIFKRIAGIFEKENEKNKEINEDEIIYEQFEADSTDNVDNYDLDNSQSQSVGTYNLEEEKDNENLKVDFKQEKQKKEERQKKEGKNTLFPDNSLNQNDIVRGIVFKQILDKPRAKNPWKPLT